ncbi:MAG: hypothetical protein HY804_00130 [Nitrospinae bacterium]|nr:hypothetical protein [Nitrospinota bacterium]
MSELRLDIVLESAPALDALDAFSARAAQTFAAAGASAAQAAAQTGQLAREYQQLPREVVTELRAVDLAAPVIEAALARLDAVPAVREITLRGVRHRQPRRHPVPRRARHPRRRPPRRRPRVAPLPAPRRIDERRERVMNAMDSSAVRGVHTPDSPVGAPHAVPLKPMRRAAHSPLPRGRLTTVLAGAGPCACPRTAGRGGPPLPNRVRAN